MMKCDVIVIGGGAAGLMCAIEAGKRGRSVMVLEHADRVGKKILFSGGGRCNFTNTGAGPENYLSSQPHFCKSALARYQPADFIALVESHGIAYHEKKLGQLFCDISSKQIVEMLEGECQAAKVKIQLNCEISEITKPDDFQVATNAGVFECESVVIATGGLSFPKMGATDFGYRIAQQFGLSMTATRPGLVPLLFSADDQRAFSELSGISFDAFATVGETTFRENILLTHRGLSGPAILQISNYLGEDNSFSLDLLPNQMAHEWLFSQRSTSKELKTVLGQFLPQRFAQQWCERIIPSRPLNTYSISELETIAGKLQSWKITSGGTEGYAKAEVTLGGVATAELSSKTMGARKVPGLYFIGEVVDVTGWLGGYNFQWAWASGHAAGQFA